MFLGLPTWGWVLIVALVAVGVIVGYPLISAANARQRKLAECASLQAQLALLRTQGGDAQKAQQIEAQLILCAKEAGDLGAEIDVNAVTLERCTSAATQIGQEWSHYKSTSYDDPVKRNNTRSTILRLGEDMAGCFVEAIDLAETPEQIEVIRAPLMKALQDSIARSTCFQRDMAGCGRFGVNEPHGNDKAREEIERVQTPLRAASAAFGVKVAKIRDGVAATAAAGAAPPPAAPLPEVTA